jgi:hypothetical protein
MNEEERSDIRKIIDKITNSSLSEGKKLNIFSEKYPTFKKKYPGLFDMACTGRLKSENLEFMLTMLEKMDKEKMTQYDASAQVGTMLYEEYVKPRI